MQHHRCFVFLAATAFILGCTNSGEWFDSSWPKMGAGEHQWVWQSDWLPGLNGEEIGPTHGCVAIDSLGLVYLNTDAAAAIRVYSPGGKLLRSFGDEWSGGLHGMEIVSQGGEESIFITHLGRHQVAKLSMEGDVHWVLDWPQQSGLYKSAEEYKPTSIAVAEDGRFWVADGYGRGFVHCYSADGEWLSAFGGPGSEDGKFRTPHGISWDANAQSLIVSDRENRRLQVFSPRGELLRVVPTELRRPCHVDVGPEGWVVAELAGRVSVLDKQGNLLARLGDQPNSELRAAFQIAPASWSAGEFIAPHCAAWGPQGEIYVAGWNRHGRLSKLLRTD